MKDSIKLEKSEKAKVFLALDPECPLCKSYSKKLNYLHQKYKNSIDFYGFFPTPIFQKKTTRDFIEKNELTMELIIDTNQILTQF